MKSSILTRVVGPILAGILGGMGAAGWLLWSWGTSHGVDPVDMMGLMRQAMVFFTGCFLFILTVTWLAARFVAGRMRQLMEFISALQEGRFSERLELPGRDELVDPEECVLRSGDT